MLHPLILRPLRCFCAAVFLAAPPRLSAAIPGADNPQAYTEHRYLQQLLEFNTRTLAGAYKQVGHRDPRWDDAAIAFLTEQARYMSNSGTAPVYRLADVKTAAELEQLARKAIDAGCDDPLVLDMYSITLLDQHRRQEYAPLARKTADALMQSRYPVYRAGNSARRAWQSVDPKAEPELCQQYGQRVYDCDLATAALADLPGIDRRILLRPVQQDLEGWPSDKQAAFCADLKKENADPWLLNMLTGVYHINAAWAARGSGVASTVTDEGWRKMHDELVEARKCLTEAHRLQSGFPEAAAHMITVVMGDEETGPGDSLRDWFDRAVQAQFDYRAAYHYYLWAIRPRWGGSYPLMYRFAVECAQTGRYDTCVPLVLTDTLLDITEDSDGDWSFWSTPGVIEQAADVLTRAAELKSIGPRDREFFYSELVGYAWQAQRYDIGRSALDKLQNRISAAGIALSQTIPPRTFSGTYAMTGPAAADLKQAEASAAAGNYPAAIESYRKIAAQTPPGDASLQWLRGRPQELSWQQQFQAGDWVNLITADRQLPGWYAMSGSAESDGSSIIIQSDDNWAQLICGTKFGGRWELRAEVEVIAEGNPDNLPPADAGPVFCWISPNRYCHLTCDPGAKKAGWRRDAAAMAWFNRRNLTGRNTFQVTLWDERTRGLINDKEFLAPRRLGSIAARPDNRIGLGCYALPPGAKIKVSQLQIRKLAKPPEGIEPQP